MITFKCSHCAQEYTVRPEFAGRRSKCRRCGEGIEVPKLLPPEDEPLVVSDALLPADYGADPLADKKTPEAAATDQDAEPQDASWVADRCRPHAPREEDIPYVQPVPEDHLEEVPDDPPAKKKKKKVRLPVIHGIDAVVKIRSPNVVVYYDDRYTPKKIYITSIANIDITQSGYGDTGEIHFQIGIRHLGMGRFSHQVLDDIVDEVVVTFPASETRKVMFFQGVVESAPAQLIMDSQLGR